MGPWEPAGLLVRQGPIRERQQAVAPIPPERALVDEACDPLQERPFGRGHRPGTRFIHLDPRHRGQEHTGIELRRPLLEPRPVDHSGAVARVEHIAVVEGAMDEAWSSMSWYGSVQNRRDRGG